MKKGLFSKLIATFTVVMTISFVIVAGFLSLWFENYYFSQRNNQLYKESQYAGTVAVQYMHGNINSEKMDETLNYLSNYLSADIWLVDSYGYVFAVSGDSNKSIIGRQILTSELEDLRAGKVIEKRGVLSDYFKNPVHTLEIPISYNETFQCVIVMNTPLAEIREPLWKVYEIIWLAAILAIIVSSIIIYYFSEKIIIRPLKDINYVADKISKGEVEKRVHITSDDEIGELANSFNSMADSIEEVENRRRLFISNVSHEIRSPITSIKGFIGGILDGVIPVEKVNYYLSVTYEEIQRLTRLVNDLLDLSAIEAGQFKLRIDEVDINELIRLTVIQFDTKIMEKKIKVEALLQGDKLMVAGDRDRLIQVMTNLIDNAVKYAPVSGNINIKTIVKGNKAFVSVFNNGPLIPEADIKFIWDRFYKADKARSSKISTGLGLPIVRSILTQLGEDIWVENKESKGVMFTFTLKMI